MFIHFKNEREYSEHLHNQKNAVGIRFQKGGYGKMFIY